MSKKAHKGLPTDGENSLNVSTYHPCSSKPPLPLNTKRKRKASRPILSSISNIVPFRLKKPRLQMGSACAKGISSVRSACTPSSSNRHHTSKISPASTDSTDPIKTTPSTHLFCKSDISFERVTHLSRDEFNYDERFESGDSFGDVFEETPGDKMDEKVENLNGVDIFIEKMPMVDSPAKKSNGRENTGSRSPSASRSSSLISEKQQSLPNLRPNAYKSRTGKRFSQGDAFKMSFGCSNLMEAKNSFVEKQLEGKRHTSVVENQLSIEKRRKRLPPLENGIHVLEAGQVNYYQMLEEVGRGSFGAVCKCRSFKDNCFYAMKMISKKRLMRKNRQLSRNPGSKSNPLDSLYREVAILKKVDHPNIVKLVEVIDDTQVDNFYMIFELMTNGVVIDIPTENVICEERARRLFQELVLGIEYLHYSKIIHRDIKPANLLLNAEDHLKISDFGVSNMFEGEDDLLSKYAGSPAFQAPEVLDYDSRDKYSGKAVDVWAMGVTLYCFLYGKCPFFSHNFGELGNMIKCEPVSFPDAPFVNPEAHDLIARMLSKQAKDRITVVEVKEHPWVTEGDRIVLPSTEDNCTVIEVTDEEVKNSIKTISRLSALVLAKSVLKAKSFLKGARLKSS